MSQTKTVAVFSNRATATKIALAVVFGFLIIAMEDALHLPVRAPGHRAFGGALALLVFAEAFAPLMLIGFAAIVSTILAIQGNAAPTAIAVWVSAAVGIWLMGLTAKNRRIVVFLAGGLLFGLLRYLSTTLGFHHTPEIIRLGGHLGFGCAGGLLSYGIASLFPPRK